MTSRDFCFWLQGYFELTQGSHLVGLSPGQVDVVKRHLALVFAHEIDPAMGEKPHQGLLDALHHLQPPSLNPTDGSISGGPSGPVRYRC